MNRKIQFSIETLARKDQRYAEEAYAFVLKALHVYLKKLDKKRHITAAELLEGVQQLGDDLYGQLHGLVLNHWGIQSSLDVGHIVFLMIEAGVLGRNQEDQLEDFLFHPQFDHCLQVDPESGSDDLIACETSDNA
jgi:uncharacterized repeat protein (TIGR04138 family)